MLKKILISLLILLNCSVFTHGQETFHLIKKSNIIDEVRSSNCLQQTEHFNLKGKVKQLVIIAGNQTDTISTLQFNKDGFLTYKGTKNKYTQYTFKEKVLVKKKSFSISNKFKTTTLLFNSTGQLTSKEMIGKSNGKMRKITALYSYKERFFDNFCVLFQYDFSSLLFFTQKKWIKIALKFIKNVFCKNCQRTKISVKYNYDIYNWDIRLNNEKYIIQFDYLDRVSVIYNKKYTRKYSYDFLSGKLIKVSYEDSYAPGNLAPNLLLTIDYNEENRTINKSFRDLTERSSLRLYSYDNYKKTNSYGDVIEERIIPINDGTRINRDISSSIEKYSYTYDLKGNWKDMFQLTESTKNLYSKRLIEYY